MGKCKCSGQLAGLFSRAHRECEEKHDRGFHGIGDLMRRHFAGVVFVANLKDKLTKNRVSYFLTEDIVAAVANKVTAKPNRTVFLDFDSRLAMNILSKLQLEPTDRRRV